MASRRVVTCRVVTGSLGQHPIPGSQLAPATESSLSEAIESCDKDTSPARWAMAMMMTTATATTSTGTYQRPYHLSGGRPIPCRERGDRGSVPILLSRRGVPMGIGRRPNTILILRACDFVDLPSHPERSEGSHRQKFQSRLVSSGDEVLRLRRGKPRLAQDDRRVRGRELDPLLTNGDRNSHGL